MENHEKFEYLIEIYVAWTFNSIKKLWLNRIIIWFPQKWLWPRTNDWWMTQLLLMKIDTFWHKFPPFTRIARKEMESSGSLSNIRQSMNAFIVVINAHSTVSLLFSAHFPTRIMNPKPNRNVSTSVFKKQWFIMRTTPHERTIRCFMVLTGHQFRPVFSQSSISISLPFTFSHTTERISHRRIDFQIFFQSFVHGKKGFIWSKNVEKKDK